MAADLTKIFFVTLNEDIIQQLQLNQNANVKIIDLDEQQLSTNVCLFSSKRNRKRFYF